MDGETSATTSASSGSTVTTSASSSTHVRSQAPPSSLFGVPADRQAVQVIQQAVQRPQSMAAQYLQQMYTAQQQHLMLQTAALQQQQHLPGTPLQTLAGVQQAALPGSRQSPSSSPTPSESVPPSPGSSQTSMTLPTSPVTPQLGGRTPCGSSSATGGTVSQQAVLLGNGSPACSQAQVYLRTQMLILTPAATMATVQPDLPVVSSASAQVQSLALRAHPPAATPAAQIAPVKAAQAPQAVGPSLPKSAVLPQKSGSQQPESAAEGSISETRGADLGRLQPGHQLVSPSKSAQTLDTGSYTAVQSQALVKHQLHCASGHKGAHHQLIIQQPAATHRQVQHIALRVTTQEAPSQHCLPVPNLSTPPAEAVQSQHCATVALSSASEPETVTVSGAAPQSPAGHSPTLIIQPPPPVLVSTPPQLSAEPLPQGAPLGQTSLPPAVPPPLHSHPPPASLQRLSLRSVQALAAQSGQMLVSEEELPVAEALVQMPYQSLQNLPPPQTMAVDLKVQPAASVEPPVSAQQLCEVDGVCAVESREDGLACPQRNSTPTPPTLSPSAGLERHCNDVSPHSDDCTAVSGFSCLTSAGNASVIRSSGDPPYVNRSPPPLLPAVVRSTSKHPPASLPGGPESQPPQAIVKPHILTHLIEGFVIQEGLEPFPVSRSSLGVDQQATLPEVQETKANGGRQPDDSLMDPEQAENSTDTDMDEAVDAANAAVDGMSEAGLTDVLRCEFCGKTGYANMFLRSKRFCSMTCVRRFNVSCTKRISLLKAEKVSRWPRRTDGRRGRPPRRIDGGSREHFLRQAAAPYSSIREAQPLHDMEVDEEEEAPVPMTTRLRRQAERDRDCTRGLRVNEASDGTDGPLQAPASNPMLWTVEEVCSFIYNLPGCQEIAEEFRSQEIDGQALLLLTEEHLMGAMNIKLGPALKICARINSLKDP